MSTQALENALNEIKNVCPEVANTFIFNQEKTIIAKDKTTPETTITDAIDAFTTLNEKAKEIGGLESATFEASEGTVAITRLSNSLYFTTVASAEADPKTLNVLTHILMPIILKAVETIQPEPATPAPEPAEEQQNTTPEITTDPFLPDAPVSQLIVETQSGLRNLIASNNTVNIDSEVVAQWKNLYGERKIEEVQVEETQTGRKMRFKFKPTKTQKSKGKSAIQMSEKAQQALQTKKGALVVVKPIIEQAGTYP